MAELAAIGLASNLLSFIDFGLKLFASSRELYRSVDGWREEDLELFDIIEDLRSQIQGWMVYTMQPTGPSVPRISRLPGNLQKLLTECDKLAMELFKILEKLNVRDKKNHKWESFKKALSRVMKEKEIQSIENRLLRFQRQIGQHMLHLVVHQQSSILEAVGEVAADSRRLDAKTTSKLDEIKAQLVQESQALKQLPGSTQLATLADIFKTVAYANEVLGRQNKIIHSLRFPAINFRMEAIKPAHTATFNWIFESPESNFVEWLETGSGIYWIQGKAGSGKSTLMKYLTEHEETPSRLQTWAGDCQLYIGSHFFWNAGSPMQKSQKGLLRTLLFQVFCQCPELVELLCPSQGKDIKYRGAEWRRSDLFALLQELGKISTSSAKFCFFVDGLDEYQESDGAHRELAVLLKTLASSPSIKICVSSRPWNVFVDAFGRTKLQLKLEELTQGDIRQYVLARFQESVKFRELELEGFNHRSIIADIVERAQGVFLWVFLVVESLLDGLSDGDNLSDMQRRLNGLPSTLEKYFEHIIERLEPFHREETIRCLELAVTALQPLPIVAYKYLELERDDPDYALASRGLPRSQNDLKLIHTTMKVRLNARCRDLLEVRECFPGTGPLIDQCSVNFLHRTVRDFLVNNDIVGKLRTDEVKSNPYLSLCRVMLALLKTMPLEPEWAQVMNGKADFNTTFACLFSVTDQLMHYCRRLHYSCQLKANFENFNDLAWHSHKVKLVRLLDELDAFMSSQTSNDIHRTNLRGVQHESYRDFESKTFLAATIEAGLSFYVWERLKEDAVRGKEGRPLLDYALRPHRIISSHLFEEVEAKHRIEIVRCVLMRNADPNEKTNISGGQEVWKLYCHALEKEYEQRRSYSPSPEEVYTIIEKLVEAGANLDKKAFETLSLFLAKREIDSLKGLMDERRGRWSNFSFWNLLKALRLG